MVQWHELDSRLGLRDARSFAEHEIKPLLEAAPVERRKLDGNHENRLELPMSIAFFGFIVVFLAINAILPGNFGGEVLRFLLFPVLFLGMLAGVLLLFGNRVAEALTRGKERFIARSKALSALARALDLTYVPAPGGAPKATKALARQNWAPAALKDAIQVIDDHGGMDIALTIARSSGVMSSNIGVFGSQETRDKYHEQKTAYQHIEDGFYGVREGVEFSAFEWVEDKQDSENVHHLAMVFEAPRRLHGVTQLRSRHIPWPNTDEGLNLKSVGVIAPAFEDRFRMRSTDQVEARYLFDPVVIERVARLAKGEKVRAVAFDTHLVIDVTGDDRFAMVDLVTGAWSEESIVVAMTNVAEMLELADAVAHAFKLRAAA